MKTSLLVPLLATLALATPTPTLQERATTMCGQWDTLTTGGYTIYQDLWGKDAASSGSQCSTVNSVSSGTVNWSSSWTWAGGSSSVKSFANAVVTMTATKLSGLTSLVSTWNWSYTGSNIVADVAYDLFLSSTASGDNEYEIMIWLAALGGAGPISATGSPVATTTIAGTSWKLYKGLNGAMTVFSFVASSQVSNFSGDLMTFIKYLETSQGLPSSQYLKSIGAGTEPFTGTNAVFKVSTYKTTVV